MPPSVRQTALLAAQWAPPWRQPAGGAEPPVAARAAGAPSTLPPAPAPPPPPPCAAPLPWRSRPAGWRRARVSRSECSAPSPRGPAGRAPASPATPEAAAAAAACESQRQSRDTGARCSVHRAEHVAGSHRHAGLSYRGVGFFDLKLARGRACISLPRAPGPCPTHASLRSHSGNHSGASTPVGRLRLDPHCSRLESGSGD